MENKNLKLAASAEGSTLRKGMVLILHSYVISFARPGLKGLSLNSLWLCPGLRLENFMLVPYTYNLFYFVTKQLKL